MKYSYSGAPQSYRGEALGLSETGRGSLATTGQRLGAFLVDAIASALIAGLFTQARAGDLAQRLPALWSLVPLAADYVLGMLLLGRTLGMNLFGLRIIRVDADEPVGPVRAVIRTLLLFLLVPALVWDRDGRGLHDRATDTAVIRNQG